MARPSGEMVSTRSILAGLICLILGGSALRADDSGPWGALAYDGICGTRLAGDANLDGHVDVGDIFFLVNFVFVHGAGQHGDLGANGDGLVDGSDVVYLVNYLFATGPAPKCQNATSRTQLDIVPALRRSRLDAVSGRVSLFVDDYCAPWTGCDQPGNPANYCGPTAGMNLLAWYGVSSSIGSLGNEMRTNNWMSAFDAVAECTLFCGILFPDPVCTATCYAVMHSAANVGTLPPDMQRTLAEHSPRGYLLGRHAGNPGSARFESDLRQGEPTLALIWYNSGGYGTLHWTIVTGTYDSGGSLMVRLANASPMPWNEFVSRWSFEGMSSYERTLLEKKVGIVPLISMSFDPTTQLRGGDFIPRGSWITSHDGRFMLILDDAGNLVLYATPLVAGSPSMWRSGTTGLGGTDLQMQPDGNLVLYNAARRAIWSTHTNNHPGAFLALQDDGNVVIYGPDNHTVLWSTNTCCH